MSERRIRRWFDGDYRPTSVEPPLLSSARSRWSGFIVESDPCRAGRAERVAVDHTELIMATSGGIWVEETSVVRKRFDGGPQSITIWPKHYDTRGLAWGPHEGVESTTHMVSIQLDDDLLRRLDPEAGARQIELQAAIQEPTLAALVGLMEGEIRLGCPTGAAYGEYLSLALAIRMNMSFGKPVTRSTRLSVAARSRVREHVLASLDRDVSLIELAQIAGLSPRYFSTAFRNSFGLSVHQYVIRERIAEARRQLAAKQTPIAEIALNVGFSSQSHFTTIFKKNVGATPSAYRAAM